MSSLDEHWRNDISGGKSSQQPKQEPHFLRCVQSYPTWFGFCFFSSTLIGRRSASSHLTNRCDRLLQRRAFPVKAANQEELTGEMWQQSNSKHDVRCHWWSPCQSQSAMIWAVSLSHLKCCDKKGEEEQTLAPPSGQLFISFPVRAEASSILIVGKITRHQAFPFWLSNQIKTQKNF